MKTRKSITALAAILAMCATVRIEATPEPSIPVGTLDAYPTMVRTGAKPNLTWSITYPSVVKDYVDVEDDKIIPKTTLIANVRVLGTGVTVGQGDNISLVPAKAEVSYDSGYYQEIFYGTNDDVVPSEVVWTQTVEQGKTMRFGGRYYYNGGWGPHYKSGDGTTNIRTLVNGDVPPSFNMVPGAPTLESFLRPYLDSSGRVKIGPMDVICFMELTHTSDQSDSMGYDFQDMVLLITFKEVSNTDPNNSTGGSSSGGTTNDGSGNTDDDWDDSDWWWQW